MTSVQEAPQIFTLLTVLCVLTSLVTFAVAAYRAIRGRRASAVRLLVVWCIAAVVYVLISATVSFFKPAKSDSMVSSTTRLAPTVRMA